MLLNPDLYSRLRLFPICVFVEDLKIPLLPHISRTRASYLICKKRLFTDVIKNFEMETLIQIIQGVLNIITSVLTRERHGIFDTQIQEKSTEKQCKAKVMWPQARS